MLNQVVLIGHLEDFPRICRRPDGRKFAELLLATSESWNDKVTGEPRERVERHQVVVFGPLADRVDKECRKGTLLFIEGRLRTRKAKAADNPGKLADFTEVVVSRWEGRVLILDGAGRFFEAPDEQPLRHLPIAGSLVSRPEADNRR